MIAQLFQIFGAVMILVGYALGQFGLLKTESLTYFLLNFIGSIILGVLAWLTQQWGFLLLEGVWAIISVWGFVRINRTKK